MKKLLLLAMMLFSITAKGQTDTIIWYDSLKVYKIDTGVLYGNDTSQAPNYFWASYFYISSGDSIYQAQFIMYNDTISNDRLLPTNDLIDNGWRSSGTVKEFKLNSTQIGWTPIQLRDSLILPDLKTIYGNTNVTKL